MNGLGIGLVVLLVLGGVIATSSLIVANKPDARAIVSKLIPLQGLVGVLLLVLGIVYFFAIGPGQLGKAIQANGFVGMIHVSLIVTSLLLGFYFSMLLVASMIPGRTMSENKAVALAEKLGMYSLLLGLLALATAAAYILQMTGLLTKLMSL